MKKKTEIIRIVCLVALFFALSGCGNTDAQVNDENTVGSEAVVELAEGQPEESTEEPTEKPTEKPTEEPAEEPEEEPRFVPENGLQVIGPNICDANGDVFQLRGVSTHGIQWYPQYINQELFTQMHDEWNCNVIRIANYVEEIDGYCTGGDQEMLNQLIDDAVTYATEAKMYVIIDWHVMKEGDPRIHQDEAIAFFDMVSEKYADNPYVLYEICNEPNGEGINWDPIYEYANAVIPVIRENSPYSVVIVGTPMYSAAPSEPLRIPLEYDNLVYAYHFYAKSHRESRQADLKKAYEQGVPLLVSEFGTVANSGSGEPDNEMADQWISILDEYGIGYICWNLSNNKETSALIVPECEKTSGFETEDLKPQGQWLLETLAGYSTTP
ncbi:MAG TPA: glycoside hydrolase family 5 protein [Lachnospiraceae bacterium]|nr:glycoside hydrolase family 5 protein [Lachnospiraceae bacterium]